jgi:hypothetical protein
MKEINKGLSWTKIAMKKIRTKLDTKIKWNKMPRSEIEKNQLKKVSKVK